MMFLEYRALCVVRLYESKHNLQENNKIKKTMFLYSYNLRKLFCTVTNFKKSWITVTAI